MLKKIIIITLFVIVANKAYTQDSLIIREPYEISIEKEIKKGAFLSFIINDSSGRITPGFVTLKNKRDEPIVQCFSDKEGKINVNLYDFSTIKSISVGYVGYDVVAIPISRIKNKIATVKVILYPQHTTN